MLKVDRDRLTRCRIEEGIPLTIDKMVAIKPTKLANAIDGWNKLMLDVAISSA